MKRYSPFRQLAIYTLAGLAFGWCAMALVSVLPSWWQAYLDSSLARYELMTESSAGPADYMIYHQDFDALELFATNNTEILSIDRGLFSRLGRVVFASAASPAINDVRLLPGTGFLVDSAIPIICH